MAKKKPSKMGTEARNVSVNTRQLVLHEAGYKCANPACRYPLTLDVHHLYYVSEGGSDDPHNLLPLCPNCHAAHHHGHIPTESLRAWKMILLALNEAFDRQAIDLLLTIAQLGHIIGVSADGLPHYAGLVASNLVCLAHEYRIGREHWSTGPGQHVVTLSEKGRLFVEAWKRGDQRAAIDLTNPSADNAPVLPGDDTPAP